MDGYEKYYDNLIEEFDAADDFDDDCSFLIPDDILAKAEKEYEEDHEKNQANEDLSLFIEDLGIDLNESISDEEFNSLRPGDFIIAASFAKTYIGSGHHIRPMLVANVSSNGNVFCYSLTSKEHDGARSQLYIELTGDLAAGSGLKQNAKSFLCLRSQSYNHQAYIYAKLGHASQALVDAIHEKLDQLIYYKIILQDINYDLDLAYSKTEEM